MVMLFKSVQNSLAKSDIHPWLLNVARRCRVGYGGGDHTNIHVQCAMQQMPLIQGDIFLLFSICLSVCVLECVGIKTGQMPMVALLRGFCHCWCSCISWEEGLAIYEPARSFESTPAKTNGGGV